MDMSNVNIIKDRVRQQLTNLTKSYSGITFFMGFTDKSFIHGGGWNAPSDYDPTTKEWYKSANADKIYLSEPYVDSATKKW